MIKKIIRLSFIPILLLGTVLTALIFFSQGNDLTIITKQTTQIGDYTWNYYKFDTLQYLINLENSIKGTTMTAIFEGLAPDLPPQPTWTDILSILKYIANSFIFVPNMAVFLINSTVLIPIKVLFYPLNIIITLMGINTANVDYIKAIVAINNMYINYIAYI